jgi:hypothetical protein
MVGWIQRMFGTQMYHEEMQVKFEYGCGSIITRAVRNSEIIETYSLSSLKYLINL